MLDEHLLDYLRVKIPRRLRRRTAWKFRKRDRAHGRYWKHSHQAFVRRIERDYTFNRCKTHPDTGYGVAYAHNPAVNEM
jgi:hypothetical protein